MLAMAIVRKKPLTTGDAIDLEYKVPPFRVVNKSLSGIGNVMA